MPEASLVPMHCAFRSFRTWSLLSREGGTLVSSAQSGGYVRRVPQLVWSSLAQRVRGTDAVPDGHDGAP